MLKNFMSFIFYRIGFVAILKVSIAEISRSANCDLFLRNVPSFGIGVYAGRLYERNRDIERVPGIPIPMAAAVRTELVNYMEGLNETHGLLLLGYSSMYNHIQHQDSMVRKHVSFENSLLKFKSFGESIDIVTEPIHQIFPGNQIFSFYGDTWFSDRNLPQTLAKNLSNQDNIVHISDLEDVLGLIPGCPSSMVSLIGGKLYAQRRILKGEVIEVARAILVPDTDVLRDQSGPLKSLLWFTSNSDSSDSDSDNDCSDSSESGGSDSGSSGIKRTKKSDSGSPYSVAPYNNSTKYAVMLLGYGSLYSKVSAVASNIDNKIDTAVNVVYDWYSVDSNNNNNHSAGSTNVSSSNVVSTAEISSDGVVAASNTVVSDTTENATTIPEITCDLKMLVSFTAVRNIPIGEELVTDLNSRLEYESNEGDAAEVGGDMKIAGLRSYTQVNKKFAAHCLN